MLKQTMIHGEEVRRREQRAADAALLAKLRQASRAADDALEALDRMRRELDGSPHIAHAHRMASAASEAVNGLQLMLAELRKRHQASQEAPPAKRRHWGTEQKQITAPKRRCTAEQGIPDPGPL